MAIIDNVGPQLSESALSLFEKNIRTELPKEYRDFLLKHNGGMPMPDVIDIEGLSGGSADVQVFFGIGRKIDSSCLEWNKTTLAERLDDRLLPIASDSGGSVYCISILGASRGSVVYCDLQSVFGDFRSQPTIYFVAPDFDTFLEKLRPFR